MILTTLIKKGGLARLATMTVATTATQTTKPATTVAPVATVIVAHPAKPLTVFTAAHATRVQAWLAHIGETDTATIAEVLDQCRDNADARRYFLQRAEEVPPTVPVYSHVMCGECAFYARIAHPHLGHCTQGEPEAVAGLWDTDRRYCERFLAETKPTISIQTDT